MVDFYTYSRLYCAINPILASDRLILPSYDEFVKFLLNGHKTLSGDKNTTVLTALLKYIHETARFELTNE